MNRLSREDRERAVACLVEGNSQKFTCPHCKKVSKLNPAALMGGKKSRAKSEAARLNGKLGGRPPKRGGNPHKDANQVAHGVVAAAEAPKEAK